MCPNLPIETLSARYPNYCSKSTCTNLKCPCSWGATTPCPPGTTESTEGSFGGRGSPVEAERVEAVAQRWQEASSSGTGERQEYDRGRGWQETGIELAWGGKKYEVGKEYEISDKEAHEFNRKNFGQPGMQYEDIFRECLPPRQTYQNFEMEYLLSACLQLTHCSDSSWCSG